MTSTDAVADADRLHLADDPAGNAILAENPFALLVGMQLDQQIPMEKAFSGPAILRDRLGGAFTPAELAAASAETIERACADRPAVHRFPRAAATRLHALARMIVDEYAGDTAAIWTTAASGAELVTRIAALPGFGDQKARIFTALLAKQFDVTPRGWKRAAGDYGLVGFRSVADVVDATSLQRVREHKKAVKAAAKSAVPGA
jgi:uncharacterized HhH-GPD family protein